MSKKFNFLTSIITYPSDYDGLLTISMIMNKLTSKSSDTTKIVVAREDPDDKIERVHYHCYWDDTFQKKVRESYFDIDLPEEVVVFIINNKEKNRFYKSYSSLAAQLGIDNYEESHAAIDQYIKDNYPDVTQWDILSKAHPNIECKKMFGDKYFMLRYIMKQKLLDKREFNTDQNKELMYLQNNYKELLEVKLKLIKDDLFKEHNVESLEELIQLCKELLKRIERKRKRKSKSNKEIENEKAFCELIRNIFHNNPGITKREVLDIIENDKNYYFVYASKYLNYNKLVNDSFKNKPKHKIKVNWDLKFYPPRKLFNYLKWLDKWVEKWMTGEECERRPKGLILIGPSRTGKSSIMATVGDYVYFKNMWNSDNWEYLPAYVIMDDMDPIDEYKGQSFSFFKPWFGAQDSITITDKYRPKEDISNGKPLIWINNFDIEETFKSPTAQKYIYDNMEPVKLDRDLFTKPKVSEFFEYPEWDPKKTWYYQNIVKPKLENKTIPENLRLRKDPDQPEILRIQQRKSSIESSNSSDIELLRRTDSEEDYITQDLTTTTTTSNESEEEGYIDSLIDGLSPDGLSPEVVFSNGKGRPSKRARTKN